MSSARAVAIRQHHGVTLIELMLTIATMAIIAGIAIPSYQNYKYQAQVTNAINDIKSLEIAIREYGYDHQGNVPNSLSDLGIAIKLDPWGNPYQYLNIATASQQTGNTGIRKDKALHPINSDYDLYSMGRDGKSVAALTAQPSQDDIIRARNGQYVGLASDF